MVILSDGLNMDIDLDEGRKLPKIIIENGVTFKFNLPTDKTYYFTNPIELKGGTIEFTNSAIVRGLNIVGEGKVIINNGNYTGTLGYNVILQISDGSADFNDNGKAVDANGNSVHKYTYVARVQMAMSLYALLTHVSRHMTIFMAITIQKYSMTETSFISGSSHRIPFMA